MYLLLYTVLFKARIIQYIYKTYFSDDKPEEKSDTKWSTVTEEKVNQLQKSSVVDWQLGKSGKVREDLKSSLAKTKNKSESKENGGHKAKESKSESGQV